MPCSPDLLALLKDKLNSAVLLIELFKEDGDHAELDEAKRCVLEAFFEIYRTENPSLQSGELEDWIAARDRIATAA